MKWRFFYYTCGTFFKNKRAGKRNHDDEKDDEDEEEDYGEKQPLMRLSVNLQVICLCSNESATGGRHRQR